MPIQLDKILADIADEKVLHPNYPNASKKETDDAWSRVGKKNKLSVHEARSIFKVLQKKYEQERVKDTSAWKLYNVMDEIHRKVEVKPEVKNEDAETDLPIEEDEEYEMLEVQEEEDNSATYAHHTSAGSASDNDSPNKSMKSNSSTGSPEKDEKPLIKTLATPRSNHTAASATPHAEEKKLLNSLQSVANKQPTTAQSQSIAAAAALQKKGITMKKTLMHTTSPGNIKTSATTQQSMQKTTPVRSAGGNTLLEVGKTIQLPASIKRKLSEEHVPSQAVKRTNLSQAIVAQQQQTVAHSNNNKSNTSLTQVKQERVSEQSQPQQQQQQTPTAPPHGINIITIPGHPTRNDLTNGNAVGLLGATGSGGPSSSTAATVASTSTNGYSPRIEDIDFRNDIIFDSGNANGINSTGQQNANRAMNHHHHASEIINLGNFDNSLPPTFFKNLCNSSRHEALGLYVANVMNRLGTRSAAKLELGILRAIIDVQSDELEQ